MSEDDILNNSSEEEEVPNSDFEYHENGVIKLERLKVTEKLYKNVHYDMKGQIVKIVDLDDLGNVLNTVQIGKETAKDGLSFTYYPNGNVQSLKYFINGKINFVEKIFDTDGQLLEVITYNKGIKNGPHTIFSKRNAKLSEVVYASNKPSGKAKFYYETGELKAEINFQDGKKDGASKYFHKNGNLRRKENMKEGVRDGEISYYYENGAIKEKRKYSQGVVTDSITKYSIEGEVLSTKYYENGIEVDKPPVEEPVEQHPYQKTRQAAKQGARVVPKVEKVEKVPKVEKENKPPVPEEKITSIPQPQVKKEILKPKQETAEERRRLKIKIAVNYSMLFVGSLILIYILYNLIIYFL